MKPITPVARRRLLAQLLTAATASVLTILESPAAHADPWQPPAQFPHIDNYPAIKPSDYAFFGPHPSMSGYLFTTPAGLSCLVSMITETAVRCAVAAVGAPPASAVSSSTVSPGAYTNADLTPGNAKLLPAGRKFDAGNGVACATITADSLACRAGPNEAMKTLPPGAMHVDYGVHGFVIKPHGNWTF